MDRRKVWAIGGYDPSGAAGVIVDHRTFEAFGVPYASLITALTAQNSTSCKSIDAVPPSILEKQSTLLLHEEMPSIIKVGMIPSKQTMGVLLNILDSCDAKCVVDPIICTSTGHQVLDPLLLNSLKTEVIPRTSLLTPNKLEAELITETKLQSPADYPKAANSILDMGAKAVLIKDGHGGGEWCIDYYADEKQSFWIWTSRIPHRNPRGTGCCLSSAIAAAWSTLENVHEAVIVGVAYIKRAIRLASPNLHHAPWPVEHMDMPRVTDSLEQKPLENVFPDCGPSFFGYYPIVPSTEWIEKLVDWKVPTAQLRIKESCGSMVDQAIEVARDSCCSLFINDHWEQAVKSRAYGVHLGQEDILKADISELKDSDLRLGISTHSYLELARALAYDPSYIALGPIYPTTTKDMPWKRQGMERISHWRSLTRKPLVAIGGLSREHAHRAWGAGADVVSFVRELTEAENPYNIIEQWNYEVNKWHFQKLNTYAMPDKSTCQTSL